MKWVLFLISAFSTSQLITPLFIKENGNISCYIKFDTYLRIKSFEILEGRRNQPVKKYKRVFLKSYDYSNLRNCIDIDLSDKCSVTRKCSFSICFNLETGGEKIYTVPFSYNSRINDFIVDETKESFFNKDRIN
ncbi:hypothetical protein P3W45_000900 [Vairimorpha bombi]|jgi:hypothetical protein